MANEYGNYATLDPLNADALWTFSEGNKRCSVSGSAGGDNTRSTIVMDSGKWYWEILITSVGGGTAKDVEVGVCLPSSVRSVADGNQGLGSNLVVGWSYHSETGKTYHNGTAATYGSAYGDGAVIGVALDLDAGAIYFSLDNAWQNSASEAEIEAGTTTNAAYANLTDSYHAAVAYSAAGARECDMTMRFDHASITGDAPSGFLALGTQNLPEPAIINPDDHFFSGTVATSTSSNVTTTVPFNLDDYEWLMIIKNTTSTGSWIWVNSFIGVDKFIRSNGNNAQATLDWLSVSGKTFTISTAIGVQDTFIVEIHKAGLKSASAANTVGSLNTTETSVNATSGFSMGVYEGEGANATIGTGLSTAYDFLCVKNLDSGQGWRNWHVGLTNGTKYVRFDSTGAEATEAQSWNSTAPAATVFSIGTAANTSQDDHTILYFGWHSVPFYSAFGKYTGNGATDGAAVAFNGHPNSMFFRSQNAGDNWYYHNSSVNPTNPVTTYLAFNITNASQSFTSHDRISTGIKARNANSGWNFSGTVLYGVWGIRSLTDGKTNQGRAE